MNNYNNYSNYNNGIYNCFNSNMTYVTSLEEALNRNSYPGSENVYFHQDKQVFYRVRTDYSGKKFWQEFEYNTPATTESSVSVSQQKLTDFVERLKRLEDYVFQPEAPNEQSNG